MSFELHPDLLRDGLHMGDFSLCHLRLINDANYPWFVLIPKRDGISDTIDLTPEDHAAMWEESRIFSQAIMAVFKGEKLNVAALGNMTPQLHLHHIVRYKADAAWPGPIWGKLPLKPYELTEVAKIHKALTEGAIPNYTPTEI
ncbi:MAG: HIT domain-containing protein [Maricaulaceae bacterium]